MTCLAQFLVVALLLGCASVGEQRIVWHKASDSDLHALCKDDKVRGCAWRSGGACHVVAPDLSELSLFTLETLGHEVKHCFDGSWH